MNVVDARELHKFLEVRRDFSSWLLGRFEKYQLVKNQDFVLYNKPMVQNSNGAGGQNKKDYLLTVDCALAIVRAETGSDSRVSLIKQLSKDSVKEIVVVKERIEFIFGREIVENLFSAYTICSQYPVFGGEYRIDWYIPELNLAIEFDEVHHLNSENKRLDKIRQNRIEAELGCKFLRYKQ